MADMTIQEVRTKHGLSEAQVADFADKYVRGRARQRGQSKKRRDKMSLFDKFLETPEGKAFIAKQPAGARG